MGTLSRNAYYVYHGRRFLKLENIEWDTSIEKHALSKLGQMLEDQSEAFNAM